MIKKLLSEIRYIIALCLDVRNLGLLMMVTIIDSIASGLLSPILTPFLHSKGISFAGLGYIFSIAAILPLFLQPVMGELSDRIGRKVLIVGVKLVAALMLPLYVFLNNVWALGVLQATNALLERSASPAYSAMIGDIAPEKDRATVVGSMGAVNDLSYGASLLMCGVLLAGLTIGGVQLLPALNMSHLFWTSAALFIIAAVLLAVFLKETAPVVAQQSDPEDASETEEEQSTEAAETAEPPAEPQPQRKTLTQRLRDYVELFVSVFKQGPTMRGILVYQFFFGFSMPIYFVFIPLLAQELGAPRAWLGPIVGLSWLTFAVGQPVGGRISDRMGSRKPLILWGLAAMILCNTGIALSPLLTGGETPTGPGLALWVMIIFWGLIGIPDSLSRPATIAIVFDVVKPEDRGKAFGVLGSGAILGGILAPLSYGLLAEKVAIGAAFGLTSVMFTGAALTIAFMVRDPRQDAAEAGPEEQAATVADDQR